MTKNNMYKIFAAILFLCCFAPDAYGTSSSRVFDDAGHLASQHKEYLESLCRTFKEQSGMEMIVLITAGNVILSTQQYEQKMLSRIGYSYNSNIGVVFFYVNISSRNIITCYNSCINKASELFSAYFRSTTERLQAIKLRGKGVYEGLIVGMERFIQAIPFSQKSPPSQAAPSDKGSWQKTFWLITTIVNFFAALGVWLFIKGDKVISDDLAKSFRYYEEKQ